MITLADVNEARSLITPYVRRTATVKNHSLSQRLGANVYLKLEPFQKTGSFKSRGAFNQALHLSDEQRRRGLVAVSGGNFAQGVAYSAQVLGVRSRILMPTHTPRNYLDATRSYGAEIELVSDYGVAFDLAEKYRQQGWNYVHPFDDPLIMAGHGTMGLEMLEDVPELTDVIVSVGGGGLMTGVLTAVKGMKPEVRFWTVETEGSDTMAQALKAGRVVQIEPTSLAHTLGSPYVAEDALWLAQHHVAQNVVVSDREAYQAQRYLLERAKVLTELAASCTLAAAERLRDNFSKDSHVALVLCGGNVSLDDLVEYKRLFE